MHSYNPNYPSLLKNLCESCHYPNGPAPAVKTHSSRTTDAGYGNWEVDCWECHNPHTQEQNDAHSTTYGKYIRVNLNAEIKEIDPGGGGPYYPPVSILRTVTSSTVEFKSQTEFVDGDGESADDICQVCHENTIHYRPSNLNSHTDYTGVTPNGADSQPPPGGTGNCTTCHSHTEGFAPTCLTCHNQTQGTRRQVTGVGGDFERTSHHVTDGTTAEIVTSGDCKVCHYEAVNAAFHNDSTVDLLDPDTGNPITGFSQFSRNTSSDTLETWVTNVQNNFCMKCHDSDGATATSVSGDPLRPFSSSTRDVPDVFSRFDPNNSFHHAVRGAGSNPYTIPSASNGDKITMELPWNQDATHDQISCFDCHEASGHGGSNQRMLRTAIDFESPQGMEAAGNEGNPGLLPAGMGATVETFCTSCHKASVYVTPKAAGFSDSKVAGSIFQYHGDSRQQHSAAGGNELGCMGCHGGIVNFGDQPQGGGSYYYNGAARGNIHGGSFDWSTTTSFASGLTEHFMLGGWIGGWQISGSSGECSGGDCSHGGTSSAGKNYTR